MVARTTSCSRLRACSPCPLQRARCMRLAPVQKRPFGTTKKTRVVQLRYVYPQALFQMGVMELRKVCGRQTSDILTQCAKTDVLLHRANMTTPRDDAFTVASVLLAPSCCENLRHGAMSCLPACTSCSDVTPARSAQPFVFWKSSALVEFHSSHGAMDSCLMTASTCRLRRTST